MLFILLCPATATPASPPATEPPITRALVQSSVVLRASHAREAWGVDGSGMTVAILDTGINRNHVDFTGRIVEEVNFTSDNGGHPADAADGNGHGTHVAGIAVANGVSRGIAPSARIVAIKVLRNNNLGETEDFAAGLSWVLDNRWSPASSALVPSTTKR